MYLGTFTKSKDVMTSKMCFKYNHLAKPIKLICVVDGLT